MFKDVSDHRWHLDGVEVILFSCGRFLGKMLVWKAEGVMAGIVGYTVILVLMWHVPGFWFSRYQFVLLAPPPKKEPVEPVSNADLAMCMLDGCSDNSVTCVSRTVAVEVYACRSGFVVGLRLR